MGIAGTKEQCKNMKGYEKNINGLRYQVKK